MRPRYYLLAFITLVFGLMFGYQIGYNGAKQQDLWLLKDSHDFAQQTYDRLVVCLERNSN